MRYPASENRPSRKEINRNEHARLHGINPAVELPAKAQKDTHKDKDLQTLKFSEDLDRTLDKIASGARLSVPTGPCSTGTCLSSKASISGGSESSCKLIRNQITGA